MLPAMTIRNLVMTKRQELHRFAEKPSETHWLSYLEAV
jgi:glutamine synthetase